MASRIKGLAQGLQKLIPHPLLKAGVPSLRLPLLQRRPQLYLSPLPNVLSQPLQ
jgi:hypothetical protein